LLKPKLAGFLPGLSISLQEGAAFYANLSELIAYCRSSVVSRAVLKPGDTERERGTYRDTSAKKSSVTCRASV
jgi:hypothetical protein